MPPSRMHANSRDVPYCKVPYDDEHVRIHEYNCTNKHRIYSWPSLSDEKYILIGDSLVKFLNRGKHLRVVSVPGACAHDLLVKVSSRQIPFNHQSLVIVAAGTNDIADVTMPAKLAAQGIVMLMVQIQAMNPTAVIMFSGLLCRPKDMGTEVEYRRKLVNQIVFQMCNQRGFFCIRSWRCLMIGLNVPGTVSILIEQGHEDCTTA